MLDRRTFLSGSMAAGLFGFAGTANAAEPFLMWHNPGCGCCLEWGNRIEAAFGRRLKVIESPHMAMVKKSNGVPEDLASCHTALIGKVVVEGHVPPADIRRFIAARNRIATGLAVPGMPVGSPGMDVGHDRRQPYRVYAFNPRGQRFVFAQHG